jgi:enoyl-[acyl-carrier protein] reductase I
MKLVRDLFPESQDISQNELVILVKKGNPLQIQTLADLTKPGLRIGIGHEKQCAMGWLTQRTFKEGGIQSDIMKNVVVQTPTGDRLVNQMRSESLDAAVASLAADWGTLDFVVHAIAYSDKEQLKGHYVDTTRENFLNSMDISCFSFTDVARRALPLMPNGGSLLTLTYIGAERVTPHYNVMGVAKAALEASVRYLAADLGPRNVRVNAISAGPIKTLAASGIGDFRYILKWNELNAPMRRTVTIDEVGNSGVYLLSDLGAGVTGETLHVDNGYHVVGMMATESAGEIAELLSSFKNKGG